MRLTPADTAYLESLRRTTRDTLQGLLGAGPREVVFLDAPTYRNFGDSLIWEGTLQYLRDLGHRVVYTADIRRFRDEDLRKVPTDAPLILQGGGNLGDLWPTCEEFRRHIVQTYPQRRIVVMPQSIHFESADALRASVDAYRTAENLTILLRESRSLEIAATHFPGIEHRFCYDAALGVRAPERRSPRRPPVVIARGDKEATVADQAFVAALDSADWQASPLNQWLWGRFTWAKNYYPHSPATIQRHTKAPGWPYEALRRLNVRAAVAQLDGATSVVTNRLHAHVLAALLGIPHVVTDNSYGKISAIFNEYTGRFSTAHWAGSLTEAQAIERQALTPPERGHG